jgi:hypothetical protein
MPLLDHFRPPLSAQRHWESFHTTWAGAMADALNERWLPEGYFAEEQVHPTARVEIDVATFEESNSAGRIGKGNGGVATEIVKSWAPPAPLLSMPADFPGNFEVLVFRTEGGPTLVAAVELISPANKDRSEHRRAFATKCASYLYQGISLAIVDVVTTRRANLHNEVIRMMRGGKQYELSPATSLYAVSYRPVRREDDDQIDIWPATLSLSEELPVLPLALGGESFVPLDLELTYADACRRRRLL